VSLRLLEDINQDSRVRASVLSSEQALEGWEQSIGPLLEKSLKYSRGRFDIDDLHSWVAKEEASVMITWDPDIPIIYAAFLLEGSQYPNKKVLSITAAGGDHIEKWVHLFPAFCEVAREMGFNQIEVIGRPGWEKIITDPDSYSTCSMIIKDI